MVWYGLTLAVSGLLVGCVAAPILPAKKSAPADEPSGVQALADALFEWHLDHLDERNPIINVASPSPAEAAMLEPFRDIVNTLGARLDAVAQGDEADVLPLPGVLDLSGREERLRIASLREDVFDARTDERGYPVSPVVGTPLSPEQLHNEDWQASAKIGCARQLHRQLTRALNVSAMDFADLWSGIVRGLYAMEGCRDVATAYGRQVDELLQKVRGLLLNFQGRFRFLPVAQDLNLPELWLALAAVPVYPIGVTPKWLLGDDELYAPLQSLEHDIATHGEEHVEGDALTWLAPEAFGGLLRDDPLGDALRAVVDEPSEPLPYVILHQLSERHVSVRALPGWQEASIGLGSLAWLDRQSATARLRRRHALWTRSWPGLHQAMLNDAEGDLFYELHEQPRALVFTGEPSLPMWDLVDTGADARTRIQLQAMRVTVTPPDAERGATLQFFRGNPLVSATISANAADE